MKSKMPILSRLPHSESISSQTGPRKNSLFFLELTNFQKRLDMMMSMSAQRKLLEIGIGELKENLIQLKIKVHVDLAGLLLLTEFTNQLMLFLKVDLFQIFLNKNLLTALGTIRT